MFGHAVRHRPSWGALIGRFTQQQRCMQLVLFQAARPQCLSKACHTFLRPTGSAAAALPGAALWWADCIIAMCAVLRPRLGLRASQRSSLQGIVMHSSNAAISGFAGWLPLLQGPKSVWQGAQCETECKAPLAQPVRDVSAQHQCCSRRLCWPTILTPEYVVG